MVLGHAGIKGDKIADEWARNAAGRRRKDSQVSVSQVLVAWPLSLYEVRVLGAPDQRGLARRRHPLQAETPMGA